MFVLEKTVTIKSIKKVNAKVKDLKQFDVSGIKKSGNKSEEQPDKETSEEQIQEEQLFEVEFLYNDAVSNLKCKNLIVGPEFRESVSKILVDENIASVEDLKDSGKLKGFPQTNVNLENNDEYVEKISRFTLVCKINKEENRELCKKLPILAVIPEKTIEVPLENDSVYTHDQPISIFVTNSITSSTPEDFVSISIRMKEDLDLSKNEKIRNGVSEFIAKHIKDLLELTQLDISLLFYHNDEIKDKLNKKFEVSDEKNENVSNKIIFLGDLDGNYDFEEVFENTKFIIDELQNKPKTIFNREEDKVIVEEEKDPLENMLDDIEQFDFD